jgi:hypothetical protein
MDLQRAGMDICGRDHVLYYSKMNECPTIPTWTVAFELAETRSKLGADFILHNFYYPLIYVSSTSFVITIFQACDSLDFAFCCAFSFGIHGNDGGRATRRPARSEAI